MSPRVSAAGRDQYLENRREKILDAAIRVFGEKGFSAASVEDIARQASIGKGTIYLYFKSKDEVFENILAERSFVPMLAEDIVDLDLPVEVIFRKIAGDYLHYMNANLPILQMVFSDLRRFPDHTRQVYTDVILKCTGLLDVYLQQKMARGDIRHLPHPAMMAQSFLSMLVFYIVSQDLLGGRQIAPISHEEWIDQWVELVHLALQVC
jgi:AcrR family transcriptional regulator